MVVVAAFAWSLACGHRSDGAAPLRQQSGIPCADSTSSWTQLPPNQTIWMSWPLEGALSRRPMITPRIAALRHRIEGRRSGHAVSLWVRALVVCGDVRTEVGGTVGLIGLYVDRIAVAPGDIVLGRPRATRSCKAHRSPGAQTRRSGSGCITHVDAREALLENPTSRAYIRSHE
jgi:hypothetical protein